MTDMLSFLSTLMIDVKLINTHVAVWITNSMYKCFEVVDLFLNKSYRLFKHVLNQLYFTLDDQLVKYALLRFY